MTFFPAGVEQFLIGGLFIGFGVGFIYLSAGLISSIFPLYVSVLSFFLKGRFFGQAQYVNARAWRLFLILGLLLGGFAFSTLVSNDGIFDVSWQRLFFGGILIGFGSSCAYGCLFTHSICNMSDPSGRNIAPAAVFVFVSLMSAIFVSMFLPI